MCPKEFIFNFTRCQEREGEEGDEGWKEGHLGKKKHKYPRRYYLGSLGDLLARLIFGDFFAAQSSLSSISLESEQLQLSITVEIKLFP